MLLVSQKGDDPSAADEPESGPSRAYQGIPGIDVAPIGTGGQMCNGGLFDCPERPNLIPTEGAKIVSNPTFLR